MKRRIFVGDIQGCLAELRRLLDELRFDPARDDLEPVGDFVNRGPDSAGVLRLMREVGAGGVLGNHDLHLLQVVRGKRKESASDTFGDVLSAPDRDELVAWLADRPFLRAWPDVLLVHGGLSPRWHRPEVVLAGHDPFDPDPITRFVVSVRWCSPDGELPDKETAEKLAAGMYRGEHRTDPPDRGSPGAPYRPWFEFYPATKREKRIVVFGHWAARGLVTAPLLRGLDTGCVWGGKLTAWIAEEDRLVAVPAARAYAKPGTGG